jgi:hypothetical protein
MCLSIPSPDAPAKGRIRAGGDEMAKTNLTGMRSKGKIENDVSCNGECYIYGLLRD